MLQDRRAGLLLIDQQKNHYLPRFWLKQWARSGGQLWEFSRRPHVGTVGAKRKAPSETAYARGLYSLEAEPVLSPAADELERSLNEAVEAPAAIALQSLLADGSDQKRSTREAWSRFMYVQLDRDPDRLRESIAFAEAARPEILESFPSKDSSDSAAAIFSPASARNLGRLELVAPSASLQDWQRALAEYRWTVFRGSSCFITSDRPVLVDLGGGEAGVECATIECALSPDALLVCTPPSWGDEFDLDTQSAIVGTFNARLICRGPKRVYADRRLDEIPGVRLAPFLNRFLSH